MTQQVRCKAILFDMDGTLLDSTRELRHVHLVTDLLLTSRTASQLLSSTR